jgi:AAA+ ATPase superfamily predicted ATPase
MNGFVDRKGEIAALREAFARPSSFSLVYGQRRTGKTFLLQHVLGEDEDVVYFLADETTATALLHRFLTEAARSGGNPATGLGTSDWGSALTLLVQQAALEARRMVLVLDEFQYLLAAEPALPSILQRVWDTHHARARLHLVLCGSALGTLSGLGESGQPLHGRFDVRVRLRPFDVRQAAEFVPSWVPVERLRAYGVFGGLARHLAVIDESKGLAANVAERILAPFGLLHEAPVDLLRSEHVSSRADADAVLEAIASGESSYGVIASRAGLSTSRIDYVLKELTALDLVRREARFGDRPGARNVRYRSADPFVAFWFRLVRPSRAALQTADPARVWTERVAPRLDDHLGPVFEQIVRQAIQGGALGEAWALIDEIAPFWSRDGGTEIDLVVRSGRRVAFVECKWHASARADLDALRQLKDHVSRYPHRDDVATGSLFLASPCGFTDRLRAVAKAEGVGLLSAEEILTA